MIPAWGFDDFAKACDASHDFSLHDAILKLPKPHLDTLAYLFRHWRHVVEHAEKNLMTLDELSLCLAPIVVGCKTNKKITLAEINKIMKLQTTIMKRLLGMPEVGKVELFIFASFRRTGIISSTIAIQTVDVL